VERPPEALKEKLMSRLSLFGWTLLWMIAAAPALAESEIPEAAIDEGARLLGADRVRYLLRQIDLTEEQATHAQGLIDSILPKHARPAPPDPDEVRRIWTELEQARAAGNQGKIDALTRELRQLGQETTGDSEFFTNMEPLLTDEQMNRLARARARLERHPSGALYPVDLLRTARELELAEQQKRRLLNAFLATRKQLGPVLRPSTELKLRMINFFAAEIRALLTPEQVVTFDHRIRALRPDLIDRGLRVRPPAPAGHEAGAAEEPKPVGD
jgi:hypothetical protein